MRGAFSGALGPEMKAKALEWAHATPDIKSLPEHVSKTKHKSNRSRFIEHVTKRK